MVDTNDFYILQLQEGRVLNVPNTQGGSVGDDDYADYPDLIFCMVYMS